MTDKQLSIYKKLSQFNSKVFNKPQWEIILKGCGCPKSTFFWNAFKTFNLTEENNTYLLDITERSFAVTWEKYCIDNRDNAKKFYIKNKARKKAREQVAHFTGVTFYMVGGALSTEKPERE